MGVTLVFLCAAVIASLTGCGARRGPETPAGPTAERAPVTILSITFSEEEDATRVTIEGSGELVYDSLELLENPSRISVEIPNALVGVATPISVNDGAVTEIIATSAGESAWVEIGLVEDAPYNITQEASRLYIDIEKHGEVELAASEISPADKVGVKPLAKMDPANALTGVSVTKGVDVTEVTFTADGLIGDYNAFAIGSPPRLVIDLWNLKIEFPKNTVSAETSHLRRIRIGKHPKKTRLVLDATGSTLPRYRIDRFQNELVVALGAVESPRRDGPNTLAGVDFKQIDDTSRVVLSSSARVDYEIFKISHREIVIDLKEITAPKHLKRTLETRAFDSAVESINLYNVRSETSRDVRVVIRLRESVDFEAVQEDKRIFVDFERPARQRVEKTGVVTPHVIAEATEAKKPVPTEVGKSQATTEEEEITKGVRPGGSSTEKAKATAGGKEEVLSGEEAAVKATTETVAPVQILTQEKETVKKATPHSASPPKAEAEGPNLYEVALTPGKNYTGRHLSLDFKDAEIKNILRLIAEVSNLNVVAGENVRGKVTIRLIDVPWDQALDIVLFSNSLGKMQMGNVIRVAPVDVLKREQEELLSAKRTREKLEDLVTALIAVNYSTAGELQGQVKNILSDRGSVSIDTRTNTLIIKDIPTVVTEAKQLITSLDTKTPQVVIEARIVEASTNFSRDLGIQWGGTLGPERIGGERGTVQVSGPLDPASTTVTGTMARLGVDSATSAITFNLANLGDIVSLDVELSALETAGEGKIISAPRITTLDNKEASIEQGLRIPYLKLTAEGTATTEFIEANIKLTVTPHVTNDGHIKMTIKASKDSPDDSITVQGVPAIDKKEAITEVLVQNGDVVVIAGLYSIEKTDNVSRVPLLGKVPVLSWLFKRTEIEDDRRDLLIFISPKIIQEMA
jgi:type IV pilus assembly protein PilQ